MTDPPQIYRIDEAAGILKCKVSWLETQARKRAIPVRLIGGAYAWTDRDLHRISDEALLRPTEPSAPTAPAAPHPPKTRTVPQPTPSGFRPLKARRKAA